MSTVINESGMCFGPFQDADVFRIEKSKVYLSLGEGIKTVMNHESAAEYGLLNSDEMVTS